MMTLAQIASVLNGRIVNRADVTVQQVCTDTRADCQDALFIALKGDNFDAHDYLEQAQKGGACAALLEREVATHLPYVLVDDTHRALQRLAAWWRQQFDITLVGITGSVGKTTVKEMTGEIFMQLGHGVVTHGNLNNHIGVPLTLLRLRAEDCYAVIEMGMSAAGEIRCLTELAQPSIALVNNAGAAHLQDLGSVAAVAEAKGEIFAGLTTDGVAIINLDDQYASRWQQLAGEHRCITYALHSPADISATILPDDHLSNRLSLRVSAFEQQFDVSLNALGEHNARNALAAIAISFANDISVDKIIAGLANFSPVAGRLQSEQIGTVQVIDDSYNANPASMQAAIKVLSQLADNTLIVGDMHELGARSQAEHISLGECAAQHGIEQLICCGQYAQLVAQGYLQHRADSAQSCTVYAQQSELLASLNSADLGSNILVKGSRFAQMENVVAAIKKQLRTQKNSTKVVQKCS